MKKADMPDYERKPDSTEREEYIAALQMNRVRKVSPFKPLNEDEQRQFEMANQRGTQQSSETGEVVSNTHEAVEDLGADIWCEKNPY